MSRHDLYRRSREEGWSSQRLNRGDDDRFRSRDDDDRYRGRGGYENEGGQGSDYAYQWPEGSRGRIRREPEYETDPGMWRDEDNRSWREGARGRYAGMGPRDYRRSDERIREDVCDRLTDHPEIDATNVRVEVVESEVILMGFVPERRQKRLAEDAVENVPGVLDVKNELRVDRDRRSMDDFERPNRRYGTKEREGIGSLPTSPGTVPGGGMTGQILEGLEVLSADGQRLGRVKEVRDTDFLLDRPLKRDLYVPRSAVRDVSISAVTLDVRADEIDDMHWEHSELLPMGEHRGHRGGR